jgi:hypothetical protein
MNYAGPGIYSAREEGRAVAAGEYLKGVAEQPDLWCAAASPVGSRVCQLPADHPGRHDWQRFPWRA